MLVLCGLTRANHSGFIRGESTCHGREIPVCLQYILQTKSGSYHTDTANQFMNTIGQHLSAPEQMKCASSTCMVHPGSIASKPPKLPAHMNESCRLSSRNLSIYWPTFLRQSDGDAVKYFQEGSSGFICHCLCGTII